MSARISVFSLNGSKLDSTTPRKARVLLQQGAARKIWRDGGFAIQLLTGSRSETTPAQLAAKLAQVIIWVMLLTVLTTGWSVPVRAQQGKRRQAKPQAPAAASQPATTAPNPVVQVKSPQDTIPLDPTKIHEVKVAFGFMCVVALPEPATDLLVGNLVNFKVSPLVDGNEASATAGADLVNVSGDARYVLIRPLQTKDVLESGALPETNLTIKLASERFLVFKVKVGAAGETCYRVTVTDPAIEAKNKAVREAAEAAARERERAERASQARETYIRTSFAGMTERLQTGGIGAGAGTGTALEFGKEARGKLVVEKFDGFLVAGLVLEVVKTEAGKKPDLSGPAWQLDGQPASPRLMEGSLPQAITEKGKPAVLSSLFLLAEGNLPGKISCTLTYRGKPVTATVALGEAAPVPALVSPVPGPVPGPKHAGSPESAERLTAQGRKEKNSPEPPQRELPAKPVPPEGNPAREVVYQPTVPLPVIQPVPLTQAQERLQHLLTITSVRSKGVTAAADPAQNREALSGVAVERLGQWLVAVVAVERRIGVKPLVLDSPAFAIAGAKCSPTAILQPLPASLETRPLAMGLLLLCERPEGVTVTGTMRIGKDLHQWTVTVPPAPWLPPPGSALNQPVSAPPPPASRESGESNEPARTGTADNDAQAPDETTVAQGAAEPFTGKGAPHVEEKGSRVKAEQPAKPVQPGPDRTDRLDRKPEVKPATLTVPAGKKPRTGTGARPAPGAAPALEKNRDLAAAALAVEGEPKQRWLVEGVQIKLLEVRTVGDRLWVLGEIVNLSPVEISDFQLITVKTTMGDGMAAKKFIPAELTFVKQNRLASQGDHTRFGFVLEQKLGLLPTEFRWKSNGEAQSVELKLWGKP